MTASTVNQSDDKSQAMLRSGLVLSVLIAICSVVLFFASALISLDPAMHSKLLWMISVAIPVLITIQIGALLLCVRESTHRGLGIPLALAILCWLASIVLLVNIFVQIVDVPEPELTLYLSMVIAFSVQVFYLLGMCILGERSDARVLGQLLTASWGIAATMYVCFYVLALNRNEVDVDSTRTLASIFFWVGFFATASTSVFYVLTLKRLT